MSCLERVPAYEVGVDSKAVQTFIKKVQEKFSIHSFMILRHGKVAAEGWWKPYRQDDTHMLFSLSKAFTSTAVGFAVQEGLLSVDDFVLSFFEDKLPAEPCENMKKMRVKHLLTMSTGHSVEPDAIRGDHIDWVYDFLTSYVDLEPGSRFVYNTPATYVCSAIIQKVTGMTTLDYLKPRLFDKLGIQEYWWETCPKGMTTGGFGLNITTESIAKLGQFYLNRGKWNGQQLLNAPWIDTASSKLVDNYGDEADWGAGYGYQLWQCVPEGVYRADGAFGQYSIVLPKQDAVIAITCGDGDSNALLPLIWETLLPAFDDAITEDKTEQQKLEELEKSLSFPFPTGEETTASAQAYLGQTYLFTDNPFDIKAISLMEENGAMVANITFGEEDVRLKIGFREWVYHARPVEESDSLSRYRAHTACAGAWNQNTYTLAMVFHNTAFHDLFKLSFDEQGVVLRIKRNIGMEEKDLVLFGRKK